MDFRQYVREQLPALVTPREPEILEELAQHLEDLYREARSAGLEHEEALSRATRALTASAQTAADIRSSGRAPAQRLLDHVHAALAEPVPAPRGKPAVLFADLRRDIRYAIRSLLHAPGFTAVVIITLALGIGATAVIFSAVDAVLLRDAPVSDPDRVVSVYMQWAARATTNPAGRNQVGGSSYLDYADLRASGALDDLAAFEEVRISLDAESGAEQVEGRIVTGNYFDVLGVRPVIGRGFGPRDDVRGSPIRVVILSHRLWQQRFGGNVGIVGRTIRVNGNSYEVIGVAPRGFMGHQLGDQSDAWVPMALQEEVRPPSAGALRRRLGGLNLLDFRDVRWLGMVGRLKEGQSVPEAVAALDVAGQRLAAYPDANRDLTATAMPLGTGPGVRTRTRPVLMLLAAAVALVLLIACANVAGLMLTRASTRRREVAVRLAVGAGRGQLIRQWLTEAMLLGVLGAGAGLVVAGWTPTLLSGLGIPPSVDLSVNMNVLAFTLAVGVSCGLVFGLGPVFEFVRRDVLSGLRGEGSAVSGGVGTTRLRSAFVVLQVALSLVLLVAAGLFVRTLMHAYSVDLGYSVDRMLVADLALGETYTPESGLALYGDLLERVNALPGVVSAGAARVTVLSGGSRTVGVSTDGQPIRDDRSNGIPVRANVVSHDYLKAMGISVVAGRQFAAADMESSPRVAIISRALGERLWPGADPVGRVLVGQNGSLQVIGVVPDTVYLRSTELEPRPFFYQPLSQNYENAVTLHIRTAGDPMAILDAVREVTRTLDSGLALARPRRLADEFARSVETERMLARLTGILSGIALLLAAVGLYGLMAYTVKLRTREVGLRLALGATPVAIMQLIVGRGARLVAIGVVLGLVGAAASVRLVRAQLFGVEPTDPVTWLGVGTLLVIIGLVACGIPARRAMNVAPAQVLRSL